MKLNSAQKRQTEMLAAPVSMRDHIQGTFDAPVTLLEYGDYECTASATVCAVIKAIQDIMRDQLRFVFRNFPLPNVHPHAERAAQAAESAAAQGCFWEMYDLLFKNQDALNDEALIQYATDLGLDVSRFISELVLGVY